MFGWRKHSLLLSITLVCSNSWSQCDFEQAMEAFNKGNQVQAKTLFSACLDANQQLAASYFFLGLLARSQQDLTSAADYLQAAVKLATDNMNYKVELAVAKEWSGDLSAAMRLYEQVLAVDTKHFAAQLGMARLLHWRGHLRAARAAYTELLTQYPEHPGVLIGMAHALLADSDLKTARELFEQVLKLEPNDESALEGLRMLASVKKNNLRVVAAYNDLADGSSQGELQLNYSQQINYAWRWGLGFTQRETTASQPNNIGIPENRAIQSVYSMNAAYRSSAKATWQIAYDLQNLSAGNLVHQVRLGYAGSHRGHGWDVSVRPALLNGELVNTLGSLGYSYSWNNKTINGQLFYSADSQFADSQSVSINWQQGFSNKSWYRVGASLGRFDGRQSLTLFADGSYPLKAGFSVTAALISNVANNELRLLGGLNYAF